MPGLGAFALAGAAEGFGDAIVKQAEERRETALMKMKREWDLQDAATRREHDIAMLDRREQYDRESYARRRGDEIEDRDLRNRREDRSGERAANVYESLFGTESGGNFGADNGEGYTGRSQMGQARLDDWARATGAPRVTIDQYRDDDRLQEDVERWHFEDINRFIDENNLDSYEGKTIGGVKMTRSGMIAMAHLGGNGGMKKFLETNGQYDPDDSNGTNLSDYARTHGGLSTDMSEVWRVLADPNVDSDVKDDIRERVGLDPSGDKTSLTGEEWIPDGEGNEVLHGRTGNGQMRPYTTPDGQPVTRPEESDPVELSASLEADLRRRFTDMAGDVDFNTVDIVAGEVSRLMREEGLGEDAAKRKALSGMVYEETETSREGGFLGIGGTTTETTTQNREGEGEFSGRFDYGEQGGNSGGGSGGGRRGLNPQQTPDMPNDPGSARQLPEGVTEEQALDEARQAISNGASRAAVINRLKSLGIDPKGL